MDEDHPGLAYERRVVELGTRGRLAVMALAATAAIRVWDIGVREWSIKLIELRADQGARVTMEQLELADSLVTIGAAAGFLMLVVTGILFLRWVHRLVTLTRALGVPDLKW